MFTISYLSIIGTINLIFLLVLSRVIPIKWTHKSFFLAGRMETFRTVGLISTDSEDTEVENRETRRINFETVTTGGQRSVKGHLAQ